MNRSPSALPILAIKGAILFSLVLTPLLSAEPRKLDIVRKLGSGQVSGVVLVRAAGQLAEPVRKEFSCAAEGPCSVDLDLAADRLWEATAEAVGYGSDSWTPLEKGHLDIWPSTEAKGKVLFPGAPAPSSGIRLRFRAESPRDAKETVTGESGCSLADSNLSCKVPVGILDLSIRTNGFVPAYRWRQEAKAGTELQLGTLELRKGASLTGQVTSKNQGAPKPVLAASDWSRWRRVPQRPHRRFPFPPALWMGVASFNWKWCRRVSGRWSLSKKGLRSTGRPS